MLKDRRNWIPRNEQYDIKLDLKEKQIIIENYIEKMQLKN